MLSGPWSFRILRFAALIGFLASLTTPSQAATWYVRPDGGIGSGTSWGDARSTVQSVISSAKAGDEIWVASGVYNESLTLKAGIALYGGFAAVETVREDRDFAANPSILDATGLNQRVITADGSNGVTVDGFTIRNGEPPTSGASQYRRGAGIYFSGVSSATVSNCTISGNTTISGGGGVYCDRSSPTLTHCTISDNRASSGGGVYCSSSSPTLTNCAISGNKATSAGGGLYCWTASPMLTHCTISGNTGSSGSGVYCDRSSPALTNCVLWNHGNEIDVVSGAAVVRYSCAQGGYPGEGNINAYPQFVDLWNGDWRLRDGSPCIDRGTDVGLPFNRAGPDMGSWEAPETYFQGPPDDPPQIFRVDRAVLPGGDGLSWATAFSSVADGLFFSTNSDEIWVAAGTYNESIALEADIALYGGFAGTETVRKDRDLVTNTTILDATGLNRRVITADGTDGVTVDGFMIRNGNSTEPGGGIFFDSVSSATVSNCTITNNTVTGSFADGGGVFCSSSSPTLTHCTITENTARGSGGGVACSLSSSPTLTHCTITCNISKSHDGGGLYCRFSSPTLIHCMISGNTAPDGGGVFCNNSSPSLINCTITNNTVTGSLADGGGVFCSSSSPTLTDCAITGNTANRYGGGVFCFTSSPTLTNCTISGNTANQEGGGVYCGSSSPTLANCTISGNTTNRYGGGVACFSSSPTLTDSTITGNIAISGGGVYCYSSSSAKLTHCAISNNMVNNNGGGMFCYRSSPMLTHCSITGNTAIDNGGGVYCSSSSPTLTHCTITKNTANNEGGGVNCAYSSPALTNCTITENTARGSGGGVACSLSSSPKITNCILWNPGSEIYVRSGAPVVRNTCVQGGYPGEGNIDPYPQFVDPMNGDWRLRDGSPCIDSGADVGLFFNGAGPDMGSWEAPETYSQGPPDHVPQLFRVNHAALPGGNGLSWETAFSSVGEALFFSSNSDEIWVAAGTYYESITMNTGIALYGGFAGTETVREDRDFASNPTILDAAGLNQRVITADRTNSVTIDGFTIRNGYSLANVGGGIYFNGVSSAMVSNCTISGNRTGRNGGGGICFSSSSPTLTHCTITGNTAATSGGGVACLSSSPTLSQCTITDNTANDDGGGVFCVFSSPTLTQCTISGNTANRDGGGIYSIDRSSPSLSNCTITANTAIGDGAGVASFTSSSPSLMNSILWNGGDEVFLNSATAEVTFSAVQGGYPGEGNIYEDPLFVDPEQSDYRLAMGSPCIDSGSNGAVLRLGPSVLALGDFDGRMRIWDSDSDGFAAVDMGAYEFGPPPFVGDVFGDSRVNHLDLFRFQQVWKQEGEGALPEADQDGDRTIGPTDLTILLHVWGNVTGP